MKEIFKVSVFYPDLPCGPQLFCPSLFLWPLAQNMGEGDFLLLLAPRSEHLTGGLVAKRTLQRSLIPPLELSLIPRGKRHGVNLLPSQKCFRM